MRRHVTRCGRGLDAGTWTYEHRNLGVVYDVITDAAKERASNGVQTTSSHHDQLSLLSLSNSDDALAGVLARRLAMNLVLYLSRKNVG